MGRVRAAAAIFDKIRQNDGIWPLSRDEIIALIEYKHLCDSQPKPKVDDASPR